MLRWNEQALQLVRCASKGNTLQLAPEGLNFLRSLNRPVAIVTIAGLYRTGKSSLMNRFVACRDGFKVGSTTKSVTKGLLVWGKPLLACDQKGREFYYVIIDSEGIGSSEQDTTYDSKLMTLIFLISSVVVYNSVGAIEESAIQNLQAFASLGTFFREQSPSPPRLVWALRDFGLMLINKRGQQISAQEYLQQCLESIPGNNTDTRQKNQVRRLLKTTTRKITCHTLVRPVLNQSDLSDVSKASLRPQFIEQIDQLKADVFCGESSDIKNLNGSPMTGGLLTVAFLKFLEALNEQKFPSISDLWQSVCEHAAVELISECAQKMKIKAKQIVLPVSPIELKEALSKIQTQVFREFQERFKGDITLYQRQFQTFVKNAQSINREYKKANQDLLRSASLRMIQLEVQRKLKLSQVQPHLVTHLKQVVEGFGLKQIAQVDAYEHVLTVLWDALFIAEQKAKMNLKNIQSMEAILNEQKEDKQLDHFAILKLKEDLFNALRTVNQLKTTSVDLEKQILILKSELTQKQKEAYEASATVTHLHEQQRLRVEELNQKQRLRNQQFQTKIEKLRLENAQLLSQNQQLLTDRLNFLQKQSKNTIFEQKIQSTWSKFDQERDHYKKQIEKLTIELRVSKDERNVSKKQLQSLHESYQQLSAKTALREKEFTKQLTELKQMHADTKKTYYSTFDTLRENDEITRVLSDMTNGRNSEHTNVQSNCENQLNTQKDETMQLRTQICSLKAQKVANMQEVQQLNRKIKKIEAQLSKEINKNMSLSEEVTKANEKFLRDISEMQVARQKQRNLYESSIVRLLSNLDRRPSLNSR